MEDFGNNIKLKDGKLFPLISYSYGNYGALILQIEAESLFDVVMDFNRNNTDVITINIEGEEPILVYGYQNIAFVSTVYNGVKIALEKDN